MCITKLLLFKGFVYQWEYINPGSGPTELMPSLEKVEQRFMLNCIKRRTGNKRWASQSSLETGKGKNNKKHKTIDKFYWKHCGRLD